MTALAVLAAAVAAFLAQRPGPGAVPAPAGGAVPGALWWAVPLGALGWVALGPAAALAPLALWGSRAVLDLRARRAAAAATGERVLETCELLAAELATGQPPTRALTSASEAWPALGPVTEAAALGGDVPRALRALACRPGADGLRLVAAAWHLAHRTGSGLADALDRVAGTVRDDRATARVVAGELASARATARLVAVLPLLVLLLGSGAGEPPWEFLLGTGAGLVCLALGLALGLLGLWWIERLADGVLR